ncbi:MAG TPA: FAD:protein FMN transferase, partial [Myxococcota bacterium]|nr:FAD:protein FMN transferase [Myxococcota bacterium]
SPWRVGIRHPLRRDGVLARVELFAGGIATSGDYERFMIVAGRRYGHILDPRTGWPVEGLAGVSVVASHCLIAGTASTVAMLKGAAEGPRFLADLGLPHVHTTREGVAGGTLARPPPASTSVERISADAEGGRRGSQAQRATGPGRAQA